MILSGAKGFPKREHTGESPIQGPNVEVRDLRSAELGRSVGVP